MSKLWKNAGVYKEVWEIKKLPLTLVGNHYIINFYKDNK